MWLIPDRMEPRHHVCHVVSLPQVFTPVTLFKCITCGMHLAPSYFWVGNSVVVAGLCTDLVFNSTLPCWHAMKKKTFQMIFGLLNNVKSIVARNKMTDVATVMVEEWKRLCNGDWLMPVMMLWTKHVNWDVHHVSWGCIFLLWNTCRNGLGDLPMQTECHFKALCWEQIEQMETWGNCLIFWYK